MTNKKSLPPLKGENFERAYGHLGSSFGRICRILVNAIEQLNIDKGRMPEHENIHLRLLNLVRLLTAVYSEAVDLHNQEQRLLKQGDSDYEIVEFEHEPEIVQLIKDLKDEVDSDEQT